MTDTPVLIPNETIEHSAALALAATDRPVDAMSLLVVALVMLDDLFPAPEQGGIDGLAQLLVKTSKDPNRVKYTLADYEKLERWAIEVHDARDRAGMH